MNNNTVKIIISILIATTLAIVCFVFLKPKVLNDNNNSLLLDNEILADNPDSEKNEEEQIELIIYLQDKQAASTSDCGITYKKTIQVPQTKAVADASLEYLFRKELSKYGQYKSVVIKDEVAQVTIENDNDPTGLKLSSLSSCEARHLFAVLKDTLTQYDSIKSVELYSPSGKIEF